MYDNDCEPTRPGVLAYGSGEYRIPEKRRDDTQPHKIDPPDCKVGSGNCKGANNGAKQIGVCLAKGAVVGAASALAVGALAVGAVAVGAPVAAVTGVLGVLAVAGGAALGLRRYRTD